ncbi:hypothetical protein DWB77_04992 [Streptomyces hundungensis]|uniref:Uncharacterized protein n=1 Tax=Streptomyces hundungensis TaxID=1077946 RepID=A0A387HG37_9ACTN|nr:hypothetical protein [Streptomyces hundungensis]AYG82805.1 hypothetical protein DWB77_04992 [Streptomyces hundungensis]
MKASTVDDMRAPLKTLRFLVDEFPELPAADVHVSTLFPDRVELAFHDDLGAFEQWRAALAIRPDAVRFGTQGVDDSTMNLRAEGPYGACTLSLVAYGPTPAGLCETEVAA